MCKNLIRTKIIEEARSYLNVPYKHLGRNRQGIDCAGLIYNVFNSVIGMPDDCLDYNQQYNSTFAFRQISRYGKRIGRKQAKPGDVVLMGINNVTSHFGILTDKGVIHASTLRGRVVEHRLCTGRSIRIARNRERAVAYFRIKGVPKWDR